MIVETLRVVNDILDVFSAKKAAERLAHSPYAGHNICVVEIGTVAIPKNIYGELDSLGVWAALEHGKELHRKLKAMRLVGGGS